MAEAPALPAAAAAGWWTTDAMVMLGITLIGFLVPFMYILPPVPLRKSDALLQTHNLAALIPSKSNLKKQHAAAEHAPKDSKPARVQGLMIYPVKSCRGIEVGRSKVLPQGLEYDRLFTFAQLKSPFPLAVADAGADTAQGADTWDVITQRQFPRLANVSVELWLPDEMKLRRQGLSGDEPFLILKFPWKERGWRGALATVQAKLANGFRAEPEREVLLPVNFPSQREIDERGYVYEDVKIWSQPVRALNLATDLPEELRLYIGVSNKLGLFRIDPATLREVYGCAPPKEKAGYQPVVSFQDAYPVNVMNLSSVHKFQSEIPQEAELPRLDVLRFRPNIILSGAPAYAEETWKQVCLHQGSSGLYNDARLAISCRTTRCKLPNVDPANGERHPTEPDRSLRKHRAVDPGAPLKGCLGMQATPLFDRALGADDRESWIGVGMEVEVEETGEHMVVK